ncbi:DUF4315 family protein [Clostridia bacterium OttesenSCG-928-O13]|nr:DUF4315 family protein [Clostridia bacterium OttesenSCG-928-O13]
MNPKIQKIEKDIAKTREVVAQGQARLRELEQKKTELENTEIVAAFRSADIPLAELAGFIQQFRDGPVIPQPQRPAVTPSYSSSAYITQEDIENEE